MADEETIKKKVLDAYKAMARLLGRDTSNISKDSRLIEDLSFTGPTRELMADPLNQIVEPLGGKRILRSEAKGFKKISNAQTMVWKRVKEAQ